MPTTTSTPSWPAKRLLLILPALLALFTSCEEPTDIGLDIQPNSQIGVLFTDTVKVESGTVLLDSIITKGSNSQTTHLVGQLNDPILGRITARLYSELRLREPGAFGSLPVADSVKLQLSYRSGYGVTANPITLKVHRLTQNIDKDSAYYNFSSLPYNRTELGSATFKPADLQPKSNKQAFVVIPLKNSFGNAILNLPASDRANQDAFRQVIKGLAIVPETGQGNSILNFGFLNDTDSSFVEVFYRNSEGSGRSYKVYLDRSARRFHSVTADRSGTPIQNIDTNADHYIGPVQTVPGFEEETFIQAGIGLRTVIRFPHLDTLRKNLGTEIAINKAELIMPVVGGSTGLFAPPTILAVAEAAGNRIYPRATSPQLVGTDNFPDRGQSVAYTPALNQYTVQMGTYLQSVLYGRKENRGLVMFDFFNAVQVNRVRLKKPGPNGMRLRIYYTKVG